MFVFEFLDRYVLDIYIHHSAIYIKQFTDTRAECLPLSANGLSGYAMGKVFQMYVLHHCRYFRFYLVPQLHIHLYIYPLEKAVMHANIVNISHKIIII